MNTSTNYGAPAAADLAEFHILTALRALNALERDGYISHLDASLGDLVRFDGARADLENIMINLRNRQEVTK
jgi:hypothetical protein